MIRLILGTMMPPNAMVKRRNGGSSQYICCCQFIGPRHERPYGRTEGRFHQGRPRKSTSPAHSSSLLFPASSALPSLFQEAPRSGAFSLSLSGPRDVAPDLLCLLKPLARTLSSCSMSMSSTKAASTLEAILKGFVFFNSVRAWYCRR
jgi:hypothetical protein